MENALKSTSTSFYNRITIGFALALLVAIFAANTAINIAEDDFQRDVRNWEIRLGISADARAEAVNQWVNTQYSEIQDIANNLSVQLFMTEYELQDANSQPDENYKGQLSFIRNYLTATANRTKFAPNMQFDTINANIPISGNAGIGLFGANGEIISATQNLPKILFKDENSKPTKFYQDAWSGRNAMRDIYLSANGQPLIAFSAPIMAIQGGQDGKEKQIGVIIGIKPAAQLYKILNKLRTAERTTETILVRSHNSLIEYISPLKDNTPPLKLHLNMSDNLAGQYAITNPNSFVITNDYSAQKVLATSRNILNTPWILIHKISRDEALTESDKRKERTITISLLIIALLIIIILAVWRHGSSVRYKNLAKKFSSQERLLRLVSDNQPDAMYILDKNLRYCFANITSAKNANMSTESMIGKKIKDVIGAAKATLSVKIITPLRPKDGVVSHINRDINDDGELKVIQSKYIALDRVPRILTGEETTGTLIVEQDITQAIAEKEKRERLLAGLVDTLVSVVDRRDNFSADHSNRVAELAKAIAAQMNLDQTQIETAHIAAKLMNLGKIIMPRELLGKTGKYTAKEKKIIIEAKQASADFVKGLEFDGPVEETLRQVQEHWDGSGKRGLKGEESYITARIVAISNEYVAMTSPRAYRNALDSENALNNLMKEIGKKYERRLVTALVSYIENQ